MAKPTEVPGLSKQTPLAVAGPLLVRARLADVNRYLRVVQRDGEPDADAVHDMRVAARRLRAAMALFTCPELEALEPEVKALQDALGTVRDLQVQRAWLVDAARRPPTRTARALLPWAGSGLPQAEKDLREALRAWNGAVAEEVAGAASGAAGPGRFGGGKPAKAIRDRLATLERRADRVRADVSPRRAHRLRIAAKKVRYVAELLEAAHGRAVKDVLAELVPLQELLGALHDADVRLERLRELAQTGTDEERRGAGELLEVVETDRKRLERKLLRELERWDEEEVVKTLRRGFAR